MIKIFIDPGHGGTDPGAVGNGLQEKNITLSIAKKTRDILAAEFDEVAVKMSRTGDETVSLSSRTNAANAWGATYFMSIHINSGGGDGFESFVYSNTSAASKEIQKKIHAAIMKQLEGVDDRGLKSQNFHVLRESHMSSILTENLFIDNSSDAAKLKDENFLNKIARGHAEGLAAAFDLKRKTNETAPGETAPGGTLYKVQVGAFSEKENAERLASDLTAAGYSVLIVES